MTALDRRAVLAAGGTALLAPVARAAPAAPLAPFPGGDAALLKRAYNAMHPGLLRYQTQAEAGARLARLGGGWGEARDLLSRYLALSQYLATVRCGHTYANFFNQTKAVQAALFWNRDRLPFQFRWLGSHMVVTSDPAGLANRGLAPDIAAPQTAASIAAGRDVAMEAALGELKA